MNDPILRWLGCLALAYLAVGTLIGHFIPVATKSVLVPLYLFLAVGVIRFGMKFHLGLAVFMVVKMLVEAYFTNAAIKSLLSANPSFPADPWWLFARSAIPYVIILVCTLALYFRSKPDFP